MDYLIEFYKLFPLVLILLDVTRMVSASCVNKYVISE